MSGRFPKQRGATPPPPTPPHRKSGVPDLRPNRTQPRASPRLVGEEGLVARVRSQPLRRSRKRLDPVLSGSAHVLLRRPSWLLRMRRELDKLASEVRGTERGAPMRSNFPHSRIGGTVLNPWCMCCGQAVQKPNVSRETFCPFDLCRPTFLDQRSLEMDLRPALLMRRPWWRRTTGSGAASIRGRWHTPRSDAPVWEIA